MRHPFFDEAGAGDDDDGEEGAPRSSDADWDRWQATAKGRHELYKLAKTNNYRKGDVIFRQGDVGNDMLFLVSGQVGIVVGNSNLGLQGSGSGGSGDSSEVVVRSKFQQLVLHVRVLVLLRGDASGVTIYSLACLARDNKSAKGVQHGGEEDWEAWLEN